MFVANRRERVERWAATTIGAGAVAYLAFSLLGPSGAGAQEAPQEMTRADRVAEGGSVYGNMCGRCHNPRSPLERSDRDWIAIINHMRIRGNLTGGQVRNVLAFLQATNSDPSRPAAMRTQEEGGGERTRVRDLDAPIRFELAERGREIVVARACLGCHVVGGQGGNVGPSLDDVTDRRSPGFIRNKLANPTFDNETSMMPNFGLSEEEIEAVLAYLATLSR